jgi:hypothetical protein
MKRIAVSERRCRMLSSKACERYGRPETNIMRMRSLALLALLVLIAGAAFAHGDKKHVIGTVERLGADAVTVKTAGGSVEVKLVASTMYVAVGTDKVAKPAKLTDLHVGDRVVIHATPKPDNTLEAAEVRFSTAAAATPGNKPN